MNNKVDCLRSGCLCLIYSDRQASFEALLEKVSSVSIHHKDNLDNQNV